MSRAMFWSAATLSVISVHAAADPVRFEFTGTVDSANNQYAQVAPGSNVIGTLTIDTDQDLGGVGCKEFPVSPPFICAASGETILDHGDFIVTFDITVFPQPGLAFDTITYRTIDLPIGEVSTFSQIGGNICIDCLAEVPGTFNHWEARESQSHEEVTPHDNHSSASLRLFNSEELPYTNTGYPVFSGATIGKVRFFQRVDGPGTNSSVFINITSLTPLDPVPVFTAPQSPSGDSGGGGGAIATWTLFLLLLGLSIMRLCRSGILKRKIW